MRWRAFSLLELVVVLALVAGLSLAVVPSWQHYAKLSTRDHVLTDLLRVIQVAKQQAVTQGAAVTFCPSDFGKRCGHDWSRGWLLRWAHGRRFFSGPVASTYALYWRGGFGRQDYLKFSEAGYTLGQQGRFYLCARAASDEGLSRAVVVNALGRARVDRTGKVQQFCQAMSA